MIFSISLIKNKEFTSAVTTIYNLFSQSLWFVSLLLLCQEPINGKYLVCVPWGAPPSCVGDYPELHSCSGMNTSTWLGADEDAFEVQNQTKWSDFQRQNFSFKNWPIVVLFLVFDIITTVDILNGGTYTFVCVHIYVCTNTYIYACVSSIKTECM